MDLDTSFLESMDLAPDDAILSLPILFSRDERKIKVNLGVGSYRTDVGKPFVLNAIRQAERRCIELAGDKEYQPIEGHLQYIEESAKLILGDRFDRDRVFACQTVGGSGALSLAARFISQEVSRHLYLPNPTWMNHEAIFAAAGLKVLTYPYYDFKEHLLDFPLMCSSIKTMPPGSAIVFHSCCHNPTGADLHFKEWQEISALVRKQQIFPIFDNAYQGFGTHIEEDVKPIRLFYQEGHEMIIASSYSKNMGLYGERAGVFLLVSRKAATTQKCASHLKRMIRSNYSSPPLHTGRLVSLILADPQLKKDWLDELRQMKARIDTMRESFTKKLEENGCNEDFSHILKEKGFFSLIGMNLEKILQLREEKGIYLPPDGRINIAGLNPSNLEYVVNSICSLFK